MSAVFNMVGIGGGSLSASDAILCVTVPTGSSVTATKSGTTLTPTIWTRSADNTLDMALFSIPSSTFDANAWTVTATLNGQNTTGSVVINSAEEYNMALTYVIYFVQNGTLVEADWTMVNSSDTIATEGAAQRFRVGGKSRAGVFSTTNTVDLTNKDTLTIVVTGGDSYYASGKAPMFGIGSTRPTASGGSGTITNFDSYTMFTVSNTTIASDTYTLDVSSFSGQYYVAIALSSTSATNAYVDVTEFSLS